MTKKQKIETADDLLPQATNVARIPSTITSTALCTDLSNTASTLHLDVHQLTLRVETFGITSTMAGIIGTTASAVSLAALFKLSIEGFDMVQTAKNQAVDLKKLTLKLSIEKCRLWTWG